MISVSRMLVVVVEGFLSGLVGVIPAIRNIELQYSECPVFCIVIKMFEFIFN